MEQRKTPRTSVRKLAYINFEPYNTGGVITEISTSGLRFHTVAPLQQGGTLRLTLVLAGMNHLEAVGEVVWTDSTRKIGGVRFVILPPAAADQIKDWLKTSAGANGGQTSAQFENVPVVERGVIASSAQSMNILATTASPVGPRRFNAPSAIPPPRVLPDKPSTVLSIPQFDHHPPRRRSSVGVVMVCLLLAPIVWFGLQSYIWPSNWIRHANAIVSNPVVASPTPTSGILPGLNVSNSGETNSEAANLAEVASLPAPPAEQAPPAVPNPNSQPADPRATAVAESPEPSAVEPRLAPSAEAAAPQTAQSRSVGNPLATARQNSTIPSQHVAPIPASSAPRPADNPGESELILAWQYLEGHGGRPRDPVAASRLLWTAVKKGNVTAETTLANLYVRGEGVTKSCDQARSLLSAASDKGSIEAKRKLAGLNETSCR